jgi:hypothetical protein
MSSSEEELNQGADENCIFFICAVLFNGCCEMNSWTSSSALQFFMSFGLLNYFFHGLLI